MTKWDQETRAINSASDKLALNKWPFLCASVSFPVKRGDWICSRIL